MDTIKSSDKIFSFSTQGTCSSRIFISIDGDMVKNVSFEGGCNGNLQGIGKLVKGRKITEVISLLEGICCNGKNTSCPDQLARALAWINAQAISNLPGH